MQLIVYYKSFSALHCTATDFDQKRSLVGYLSVLKQVYLDKVPGTRCYAPLTNDNACRTVMGLSIIMSDPERVPFRILTVDTYYPTCLKRNMNSSIWVASQFLPLSGEKELKSRTKTGCC